MTALRLMTLNTGTGSGEPYVDFTAATHASFINRVNPDVVFLQEVDRGTRRAGGVDQVAALRDSTALGHAHFVKWRNLEGGEYGVAIISRLPLEDVENRSVYKPAHWWPWFVVQIVTPVAYAEIDVSGTRVHLYATHFPSNDEGRKQFGADQIAAAIPASVPTVFGGDFNDGPGGVAMAAIDAKFTAAESIAGQVFVEDRGEGIDHLYVSGGIACDVWTTVSAVEAASGRRFSDHAVVYADLQVPAPPTRPRALRTSVHPYPAPIDLATTLIVSAADAASGAPVDGQVIVDGVVIGATNAPFPVTLRRQERRTFDPDTRKWITETVDPSMRVTAPGYTETAVDLGI